MKKHKSLASVMCALRVTFKKQFPKALSGTFLEKGQHAKLFSNKVLLKTFEMGFWAITICFVPDIDEEKTYLLNLSDVCNTCHFLKNNS